MVEVSKPETQVRLIVQVQRQSTTQLRRGNVENEVWRQTPREFSRCLGEVNCSIQAFNYCCLYTKDDNLLYSRPLTVTVGEVQKFLPLKMMAGKHCCLLPLISPTFSLKVTPEHLFPDNYLSRPTTALHNNLQCFLLLKTSHTHNKSSRVLVLTYQTLQQSPSESSILGFVITELQSLLLFPAVYNSSGLPNACVFHISPTMAYSCYFWLTFLYKWLYM